MRFAALPGLVASRPWNFTLASPRRLAADLTASAGRRKKNVYKVGMTGVEPPRREGGWEPTYTGEAADDLQPFPVRPPAPRVPLLP